jgi:hypothetical protein
MVFFCEPWYLRRNKYLFYYEVPEFRILESEFRFSDSPDIGISKKKSNWNLWNQKQNQNSAYIRGPRNWNQKLEFPTKLSTLGTVLPTLTVACAPTPTAPAAPSLTPAVDDEPTITVPSVLSAYGASTDKESPHTGLPTDTSDDYPHPTHWFDSLWYHNASN